MILFTRGSTSAVTRPARGLARQLLLLQVALVLFACAVAVTVAVVQARSDVRDQAGRRCLSIAEAVAGTGWVADQVSADQTNGASPTNTLQPYAADVLDRTGVDFITIMSPAGFRYTHPDPSQIGKHYLGTIAPALAGGSVVETYTGTLGPSVRAVVAIHAGADTGTNAHGTVVALVAVGVRVDALGPEIASRIGIIALVGGSLLVLALIGTALIGRRMNRQTHGLGADELGVMHTYYDAVLHSVREGLLLLDSSGRIRLINAEAIRLLALTGNPVNLVGRPLTELSLPGELVGALAGSEPLVDAVHLAGDRVLVVSALPARPRDRSRSVGRVITLRDHTELTELTSELGTARDLTEALQSQSHESANRLHAVITLVELGRAEEAIAFATRELRLAQELTDQVVRTIADPVLAAVLLGKAQVAAELGIDFRLTPDSTLDADALADAGLEPREVVTLLGNLIDNAFDAIGRAPRPGTGLVQVTLRRTDPEADEVFLEVSDNGPGLDPQDAEQAFRRGWSTKRDDGALHGHGIGLGLVGQVVRRHGGSVGVGSNADAGAVFTVTVGR
ncbi:sensor histidine kinase regulating citrate/malate metabolism [Nakamurella sp. UYEF19]|uniref:sensor histidine kinase n=1 Tax=Nakamurella sp. UYEF19 TaxID=1756392 RepID=UPI00339B8F31